MRDAIDCFLRIRAREFEAFSASWRGCARFLPHTLKEFAKRFVADVEPIVGEALPDLPPRLSRSQGCFNVGKEEPHQCGFRAGRFGGEFLQGVAEAIWC